MKKLTTSEHQLDRIKNRFDIFTTKDLPFAVRNHIKRNIELLKKISLPSNKSFGIMLGDFIPNPKSEYHLCVKNTRDYYSIIEDDIIADSTGDQFWVIIRNNRVTTFMLRKSIQTTDISHNLKKNLELMKL